MAEESDLERSYPATPRRLEQAREQGQVARSRELAAAAVALVAAIGLWALGPEFMRHCLLLVQQGMRFNRDAAFEADALGRGLTAMSSDVMTAITPLLLVILLAAAIGPLLLSGWNFSTKAVLPDLARLNPVRGLGNMFAARGLAELAKALLKTALIGTAGCYATVHMWDQVQSLAVLDLGSGITAVGRLGMDAMAIFVAMLVLIAAIDVPYQVWRHHKSLRMTREEVRQELREQEGDPQLKARIRSLQRNAARKRMMAAVPKASVIVTNPTHYAVALEYTEGMRAPRVVAKGTELIAEKIKEIGRAHNVPLLEAPPLARALHRHSEIGDEIPQALYGVVAQVLAYVYQVERWRAVGGQAPVAPDDLAVPPDLDPINRKPAGDDGAGDLQ
ncbi:MAG: flagellar biosynthesis protein FlhB [Pseudomonadota bacterium]|nr:flagellar biosynthesis protein FlhB [Pseudomonadota bacterium]